MLLLLIVEPVRICCLDPSDLFSAPWMLSLVCLHYNDENHEDEKESVIIENSGNSARLLSPKKQTSIHVSFS